MTEKLEWIEIEVRWIDREGVNIEMVKGIKRRQKGCPWEVVSLIKIIYQLLRLIIFPSILV